MTYIVTALKPEAQAFVDRYKLKKSKLSGFTVFTNENIRLIISGIGVANARIATQTLIDQFDILQDDIFLNIGICGASKKHPLGTLFEIGEINYEGISYTLHSYIGSVIHCVSKEMNTHEHEIVDMESFGFYDALRHSTVIQNYHVFKVVSDHFEPQTVTKESTKSLLFNVIDAINKEIEL